MLFGVDNNAVIEKARARRAWVWFCFDWKNINP
jgi:hypothetical protein